MLLRVTSIKRKKEQRLSAHYLIDLYFLNHRLMFGLDFEFGSGLSLGLELELEFGLGLRLGLG